MKLLLPAQSVDWVTGPTRIFIMRLTGIISSIIVLWCLTSSAQLPVIPLQSTAASASAIPLTGLQIWLKNESITGSNNNTSCTIWNDSSGSGNHATNIAHSGVIITNSMINGLPSAYFSGGTVKLTFPDNATNILKNVPGITVFTVMRTQIAGGAYAEAYPFFSRGDATGGNARYDAASWNDGTHHGVYVIGANVDASSPSGTTVSERSAIWPAGFVTIGILASYAVTNVQIWTNNLKATDFAWSGMNPGNTPNTGSLGVPTLGFDTSGSSFDLAELILYNRVITGTEVTNVLNYLKPKFALW